MEPIVWGLDIGGTKCALVEGDTSGRVLSRRCVATADYPDWAALLEALLPDPQTIRQQPLAIGVSCGGPLDSKRGLILSPPNLPGWDEVPITAWLKSRYHVPAYIQNDANACALAEWQFGAGRGTQNMVFMTFGTGLGAGLILNGRLYAGSSDMAGEIGHVRAAQDGPSGYGKAGSFEGFCSGGGIAQLSGGLSAKEIAERAEAGDETARAVFIQSAEKLGQCLSILIDLLNPDCIVIGSIFTRAEKWFRGPMQAVIDRETLIYSRQVCSVRPAELGDSIGDIAAITVALNGLKEDWGK